MKRTGLGGAKKKSLVQMEKSQVLQEKKVEPEKKQKSKLVAEKKAVRAVEVPNVDDQRFLTELAKMGAITPYALASQFNLRLSVARDLLEELERKRLVKPVGGNARIRIYRIAAA